MRRVGKHPRRAAILTGEQRIPTEHEEQREFVSWFKRTHPGVRIYAIPNGGARSMATAARLKVEGVSKGVPDLHVPAWNVWVEMKRIKGGTVSPEQKEWHSYLADVGHHVIIGRGADDAKEQLDRWFMQMFPLEGDGVEQ